MQHLIPHVFDLIDPEHDGRVKKLDFFEKALNKLGGMQARHKITPTILCIVTYTHVRIEMRF